MAPYDAEDARGLMKAAIRDPDPVVFLENEILYGESFPVEDKVLDKDFTLPIGKCKVSCLMFRAFHLEMSTKLVSYAVMSQVLTFGHYDPGFNECCNSIGL